jgi:N-ethylmaleimide reductase
MNKLFMPVQLGAISLAHRVVMSPLTRLRSLQPGDVPGDMMVEYYGQRASAGGLIIAEATSVTRANRGYLGAPGIYSDAQVTGWKKVTDAVHAKGGKIFLQLWHVGRISHIDLNDGAIPVGPSVITTEAVAFTAKGWLPVSPNRAMRHDEIPDILEQYRQGAERAKAAGFDGVELHCANGYLLDQFLQDGTNKRTDAYGGSIANRARLLLEVVEAVVSVWGQGRVAVRLSPNSQFHAMSDGNPEATFGYVAEQLNQFGLAYLHIVEPRIKGSELVQEGIPPVAAAQMRKHFAGAIIAAGGFEPDTAEAIIEKGDADLVAFGRHFISNPDLPERIKINFPLTSYNRATFYGGDRHGYTDYPFYGQQLGWWKGGEAA